MVTPTGALLVTGYAQSFGPLPPMRVDAIGYGAGDRDPKARPTCCASSRVSDGRRGDGPSGSSTIECEIDDMNPQLFGPLMDRLLAAGALDVFYSPVQMKKAGQARS